MSLCQAALEKIIGGVHYCESLEICTWINFIWALLTSLSVLSLFELFHISESNIANNNNFLILSFVHYRQSKILFGSPLSQKSPFLLFWQFTFNLKRTWPKQIPKHSAFYFTSAIKHIFPVHKVEVIRTLKTHISLISSRLSTFCGNRNQTGNNSA